MEVLSDPEKARHFLRSAVGAYCFSYSMVLRDRHKDNMMIKKGNDGKPLSFLQIDFEFILRFPFYFCLKNTFLIN